MIKLGLCNPPELIYLYVKSGEDANLGAYLWHRYIIETETTIPVQERGLAGNLIALKLTSKTFKGKENMKLDIVVQADKPYVIRTGIETNFAKTFLLCASQVQDFSNPLIISVAPGKENVVFCRLYDGLTEQRIKAEWNNNADWASIIATVQQKLGQRDEPADVFEKQAPDIEFNSSIDVELVNQEIDHIMKTKQIDPQDARQFLFQAYGVQSRKLLTPPQLLDFKEKFRIYAAKHVG